MGLAVVPSLCSKHDGGYSFIGWMLESFTIIEKSWFKMGWSQCSPTWLGCPQGSNSTPFFCFWAAFTLTGMHLASSHLSFQLCSSGCWACLKAPNVTTPTLSLIFLSGFIIIDLLFGSEFPFLLHFGDRGLTDFLREILQEREGIFHYRNFFPGVSETPWGS